MSTSPFKPMLAEDCDGIENIKFPCYATIKIDGLRCLMIDGKPTTRSIKPIPNRHTYDALTELNIPDFDGELMVGDKFHEASGALRREEGEPDFRYYVFDNFKYPNLGYLDRIQFLHTLPKDHRIIPLFPTECRNREELEAYFAKALADGHEGVMVRSAKGPYKYGRATVKEGYLLKVKPFADSEATITGFYEQMLNLNEATIDALGHTERSSHRENKVGKNTLGGIVVRNDEYGEFKLATGFDDALRREIWNNKDKFNGRLVKFRYQKHGTVDKPRIPTFVGFRDKWDL